jgi:chemotaxis protein histidine kinase CheA
MSSEEDLSRLSLPELFLREAGTQTRVLSDGLLALERKPTDSAHLEACMRAAHSLKGAARIVGLQAGVDVAHAMEDCFVSAQGGELVIDARHIDELLRGVDLLLRVGGTGGVEGADVDRFVSALKSVLASEPDSSTTIASVTDPLYAVIEPPLQLVPNAADVELSEPPSQRPVGAREAKVPDRILRVTAEHLNRLLRLSGESLLEARRLKPFAGSMLRMKRLQHDAGRSLDLLHEALIDSGLDERSRAPSTRHGDLLRRVAICLAPVLQIWRILTAAIPIWRSSYTTRRWPAGCDHLRTAHLVTGEWCATLVDHLASKCGSNSWAKRRRSIATFSICSTRRSGTCCVTPLITELSGPLFVRLGASRQKG